MNKDFKISYFPAGTIPTADLTYVIIGTREKDKWIFVRHKARTSWELPAGHIEEGENADEAAVRELYEETGVIDAEIEILYDYSVESDERFRSGRLYLAQVIKRGELPESEIGEICLQEESPEPATYPDAHASFLEKLNQAILPG